MSAFTVLGMVVAVAMVGGVCLGVLIAGAVLLEHLTGVPATDRRLPLESRDEHRARLHPAPSAPSTSLATEPTRADWLLVGELIAAEDERRERAANVIRLEDRRSSRDHGSAA